MKRNASLGLVLAGIVVFMLTHSLRPVYGKSAPDGKNASAEAPHWGEGGVPQFQFDPAWPKVPSKWRMGFGTAVAADNDGNIWVLSHPSDSRHPRSMSSDLASTPSSPVMEFDSNGNYIRGWGGQSGPGYQWPSDEDGLTVDYKGYVWIIGDMDTDTSNPEHLPNDNQILKFTKDGKFVMAIGKIGQIGSNSTEVLSGATSLYVYPKTNELFVTDGYINARVMVYDADTGKFKRMWGAYSHKPLDVDQRPAPAPLTLDPWRRVSEVLQQFGSPTHDVKVSNDGLVYLADRGNRRIQVFTLDGKFLTEQFIGLDMPHASCRGIAFSPDERFLYARGNTVIWILNRRTLEVLGSFRTVPLGSKGESPGHLIGVDNKGNLYGATVRIELNGLNGNLHDAAFKYTFTGYTPKIPCSPRETVRTDLK